MMLCSGLEARCSDAAAAVPAVCPIHCTGARICKVDAATCPPGVDSLIEQDECADKNEQMVLTLDKTWHSCGCVQGWSYK
jgi:hypothetical protein